MNGRLSSSVLSWTALAVAAALCGGCQTQSSTTASQGAAAAANAQAEANKATFRRFMEAFNQGDTTVVDSFVTENIVDHSPMPGLAPGRAGLNQIVVALHAGFPDLKMTVEDIVADGDKVWAYSTTSGTMKGMFMSMKPTGKAMTNVQGFDLVRFENGKMVEHWGVSDNTAMAQQLGWVPPPGKPKK